MTIKYFYSTILPELNYTGGIIITDSIIEEIIESWHERPVRLFLALLLLWMILAITTIAGELITVYIIGILAIILFIGGILLVFSIKPMECKNAAWMTGIAFFLLWDSMKGLEIFKISFLNATDFLELTAIAFVIFG